MLKKILNNFSKKEIQRFFKIAKREISYDYSSPKGNIKIIYDYLYNQNRIESRLIKLILKFRTNWIFSNEIDIKIESENEKEKLNTFINSEKFFKLLNQISETLEIQNHCVIFASKNKSDIDFKIIDLYDYDYDIENNILEFNDNEINLDLTDEILFFNYSAKNKITNSILSNSLTILNKIREIEENIRKINSIFVNQVPVFRFNDEYRITQFSEFVKNNSFNIGDSLILLKDEDFEFKSPNMSNMEYLFKEKLFLYQELSSLTGIPIFMLGFPELIGGGRATAKEYIELIKVSINKNRYLFKKFVELLLRKYLYLRNKYFLEANNVNTIININIPETINSIINDTIENLNDMRRDGNISLETYLNLNPLIKSTDDELAKLRQEKNEFSINEINILAGAQ